MRKYRVTSTENPTTPQHVIASVEPTICPDGGTLATVTELPDVVQVNDGTPTSLTLADAKQLRYNEIDGRTIQIIGAGFLFAGKQFSLSLAAQKNWDAIKTSKNDFDFPLEISCLNNDTHTLDTGDVNAFWSAARDAVKTPLDLGRTLKKSIFDATTEAQVNAVIDLR